MWELQAGVFGRRWPAVGSLPSPASMEDGGRARYGWSPLNNLVCCAGSWSQDREIPFELVVVARTEGIRRLLTVMAWIRGGGLHIKPRCTLLLALVVGIGDGRPYCLLYCGSLMSCCSPPCCSAMAARGWGREAVAEAVSPFLGGSPRPKRSGVTPGGPLHCNPAGL
jgi:hypothetical protein